MPFLEAHDENCMKVRYAKAECNCQRPMVDIDTLRGASGPTGYQGPPGETGLAGLLVRIDAHGLPGFFDFVELSGLSEMVAIRTDGTTLRILPAYFDHPDGGRVHRPMYHPPGEHRHGCYSECPDMTDEELLQRAGLSGPAGSSES